MTAPAGLPTVHINGTSVEALIEQRTRALTALRNAVGALRRAWPHGRDYYPRPGSLYDAEAAWTTRLEAIQAVAREIEGEIEYLLEEQTQ